MTRLIPISLLLFMTACATGERAQNLQEGMSRDQVIAIMGKPDGFQRSGEYEALKYNNRLLSGWSWDRADYSVILREGRVVEYGAGQVRQHDPGVNTLVLVPLR